MVAERFANQKFTLASTDVFQGIYITRVHVSQLHASSWYFLIANTLKTQYHIPKSHLNQDCSMFQSTECCIDLREIAWETYRGLRGIGQHKATLFTLSFPSLLSHLSGHSSWHVNSAPKRGRQRKFEIHWYRFQFNNLLSATICSFHLLDHLLPY